jgi:hypothetical protein
MSRARRLLTTLAAPILTGVLVWGAAAAAAAHPGHGVGGGSDSWLHYLSEPAHVALPLLVAAAFAFGLARARRQPD